jgi:GTP-binding protein
MYWMGENQIPFSIVFTKADKLKPNALTRNVEVYCQKLLETWEQLPPYFITSASKANGREELLQYIDKVNTDLKGAY